MADGFFPTLISKDRDVNAPANPIYTQVTDGTDLMLVNADGSINVNVSGGAANFQYAEDTVAVTGDMGTVALAVRQDTLSSSVSADGDYGWLKLDSIGRLWVNVNNTVTVSATDLDIRDLTFATDKVDASGSTLGANSGVDIGDVTINNGAGAAAVNIQDGGNSITVDGTVAVSSVAGNVTVVATDLDIRDLTLAQDAVKISGNATANSATNPIFVQEVDATVTTEISDYNTAAAVAGNATSNHDYTVAGGTFLLTSIIFSTSGKGKVELQVGPVASLVSKAVAFTSETWGTTELFFDPPIEVPVASTGTVRLIRTNRQNQAQDLYSTIIGNQLP